MKKQIFIITAFTLLFINRPLCQVIYTDIDPDSTVSASESEVTKSYFLDLDNNGIYEFELRHFNPGPGNEDVELQQNRSGTQQVLVDGSQHSKVLRAQDLISAFSSTWGADAYGILNAPWYGQGDKYFGFRFRKSGQWHYGWARVNMPADHLSFTIMDFAYNSVPNAEIRAGQKSTSGINNSLTNKGNILVFTRHPGSKTAIMHTALLLEDATINIYNLQGQILKRIPNISGKEIPISGEELPEGIYILRLNDKSGVLATSKIVF